ncbi:NAC domain-containing protein 14-like [Arachis duranensis]|uniref:NAC domain-containing protein 14-like n=1 Tax=Arachis duranensis TaxID=130453 RepID=A0A6P5MZM9_ARADU|nr:NAC domain-containing protein 14-like [Arachis duranensis]
MAETRVLPVGYRFRPTEEEILIHYLNNKHLGNDAEIKNTISQVDLCNFDPWDLPEQSKVKSDDQEWFFFNELKYMKNKRCNRKTNMGYWKITGKERIGTDSVIGTKRTLVFYERPHNVKTNWVLHEYHAFDQKVGSCQSNIVLSRVIMNAEKREQKLKTKASNIVEEEEVKCEDEPCSEITDCVTQATTEDAIIPDNACVSSERQQPQVIDYEILSSGQQSSVAHSGNENNNAAEATWRQDADMNIEYFWNLLFSSIDADPHAEFLNSVLAGDDQLYVDSGHH